MSSHAGRAGTLVAFHHQPNHPQSHPIWQNSNHRADLRAAPRDRPGAHSQALSNSSEVIVVGPATKQFSSSSAFPLRLPTKRRPALHGSQGMLSTDPISPRSVTVLRFTWVQVLPWGGVGDTMGRTDTILSPGENDSSLGSPSLPDQPRPRSWAPAGLSVWDRMEKSGACRQEATPDAKAKVSKPAPAVGQSEFTWPSLSSPSQWAQSQATTGSTTCPSPDTWQELTEPDGCIRRKEFNPIFPKRRQLSAHRICLVSTREWGPGPVAGEGTVPGV